VLGHQSVCHKTFDQLHFIDVGRFCIDRQWNSVCIDEKHDLGSLATTSRSNLESVGLKRDAQYLLRSIIAPAAEIELKYRSHIIVLVSGKTVQGLLLRKDDQQTVLADVQGKEVVVQNVQIDESLE
jgi:hypothetical protein